MRNSAQFFRVRQFASCNPPAPLFFLSLSLSLRGARFFRSSYSIRRVVSTFASSRCLPSRISPRTVHPFSRSCSARMKVHSCRHSWILPGNAGHAERRADICLTLIGKCFDLLLLRHSSRLPSSPRVRLSERRLTSRLKVVHRLDCVHAFPDISSHVILFPPRLRTRLSFLCFLSL